MSNDYWSKVDKPPEFYSTYASTYAYPGMIIQPQKRTKRCSYCGRLETIDKTGNCESCGAPY